jgi:hypothetical protein
MQVDDAEDVNVVSLLIEPRTPDGFDVVNTEIVPGLSNLEIVCNLQMFTQIWRARMNACQGSKSLSKHFHRLQQVNVIALYPTEIRYFFFSSLYFYNIPNKK